jgi:DNA repair protein RadA/Sms
VDRTPSIPVPTTVAEIDRVLGGGFVPGSVSLLSGEPGIGKSTLTLQLALRIARSGAPVVMVTGEEAPTQVAARAERIHNRAIPPSLAVLDTLETERVVQVIEEHRPQMVIVDSVQTLRLGDEGSPGSPTLLRNVAARLAEAAKKHTVSLLLIGHVTKDGGLAGPRTLEHLVDTVLSFDGDRSTDLRFLRSVKHRFGATSEVGLFEMIGTGLRPVQDPSARFLADRNPELPGSAVAPILEGRRPVMVEIQALVARHTESAGVSAHAVPAGRLRVVTTVAGQYLDGALSRSDILVSAAGGATVNDPGGDLAMLLAMISAETGVRVPLGMAACAEIGLSGELRRVATMEQRLHEAFRLGFTECVVPRSCPEGPTGLRLLRCATVNEAVQTLIGARV